MRTKKEQLAENYSDSIERSEEGLVEQCFIAGYEAATPRWISVEEKLPSLDWDADAEVLIYGCKRGDYKKDINGQQIVASWDGKKWSSYRQQNLENNSDYWVVTHWKLLDQSPQ